MTVDRVVVRFPGPQGPAGPGATTYIHPQSIAALTWTINHGLGVRPRFVSVLDADNREVFGFDVLHPTVNQTVLEFGTAMLGEAALKQ